jgi:hypothetical protein
MRLRSTHALLASLLVTGTLASAGGVAAAQEGDCARALWAVPIEAVELPEGWTWSSLTVRMDGGWGGSIEMPKPESEITSDYDDKTDDIYFDVECIADPQAFLDARRRSREVWPDKYRDIDVAGVGDQSVAFGYPEGGTVLDWANGMIYGTVHGDEAVDASAVEDFALALDALLPPAST